MHALGCHRHKSQLTPVVESPGMSPRLMEAHRARPGSGAILALGTLTFFALALARMIAAVDEGFRSSQSGKGISIEEAR